MAEHMKMRPHSAGMRKQVGVPANSSLSTDPGNQNKQEKNSGTDNVV